MNLIRCQNCGEVADTTLVTDCPGCGQPLPIEAPPRPPLQFTPMQQEARRDLGRSTSILLAIAGVGVVGVLLIFFQGKGFMSLVIPVGIGLSALYGVFAGGAKWGKARQSEVSETAAPAQPAPRPAARPHRPRPAYVPRSVPEDDGLPSCLQVIGWLLMISVAMVLGGILILFITCAF
jgi:hypothetical protein